MRLHRHDVGLAELLVSTPAQLGARFRSSSACLLRISFETAPITLLIACSPTNRLWRFPPFDSGWLPAAWLERLHQRLVQDKGLMAELKHARLPKRSFALGLLDIDEEEMFCHERFAWPAEWFSAVLLPARRVAATESFIERWVLLMGEAAFVTIDDELWSSSGPALVRRARTGTGRCLGLVSEVNLFEEWDGPTGLAIQLERIVSQLESGVPASDLFPAEALAFINDPIDLDRGFLLRPRSRRWGESPFTGERLPATIARIDSILAHKARAVRLMGLWQHWRAAMHHLERLGASLERHPLSAGLAFDPVAELSSFVEEQRARYPLLAESPYPEAAFTMPPDRAAGGLPWQG